jgi:arylsulfatase A-like enzyme
LILTRNTLFVFSSDNGPVVDDGYRDQAPELLGDHKPAGPLRGGKYSAYDGGTRVPFLVRWPGRVKRGVSDAMVSQVDLLASLAAFTGRKLPADTAPDSFNIMPAILGKSKQGRPHVVEYATALSLIAGDWKVIQAHAGPKRNVPGIETGNDPQPQLFNLKDDIGERNNVAAEHPEKVKELLAELERIQKAGRSRP